MKKVRAVVQGIRQGLHGPFAIASAEDFEGSITFSLEKGVWQEDDLPERGSIVMLSDLRKKQAGWRATNGRYLRPFDQQTASIKQGAKSMSGQNLAQAAVKSLFEQSRTEIKNLGIEQGLLISTMTSLVATYCEKQEFELAADAATVSDDNENFRTILTAMKNRVAVQKSGRWIDVMMAKSHEENLLMTILLRVGSEEELREFSEYGNLWKTNKIRILRHLKDSEALVQFGRQRLDDYFRILEEEKASQVSNGGTSSIPGEAIEFLKAALDMGHPKASAELIRFSDRLREINGVGKTYYSSEFPGRDVDPVIKAYQLSNCREGFLKAAQCHQEIAGRYLQKENLKKEGLQELATAARLFVQAEDFTSLSGIASKFVEYGDLLEAVKVLHLSGERITTATLERLMGSTSGTATEAVKAAIPKYLEDHNCEIPFYTSYTYWHFSQSNLRWFECQLGIERLAGRFDIKTWGGHEAECIGKQLYSTSKADAIEAIYNRLQHHLIVGWMLSGVARDIKNGAPARDRKYSFSTYAAFRTFNCAVCANSYNPFDGDIGLRDYDDIRGVSEFLDGIIDKWCELLHNGNDTRESNRFIWSRLNEMQDRLKQVFDAITQDILRQVEAF